MNAPTATYRVQLNKNFNFRDLKAILPYLSQLGVSHIYASPIFQAKSGSMHGYDVTDPNVISEELGGRTGFEELTRDVRAYGLGWLQDIVPNHASYTPQNKQLADVLAKGAGSAYACFFDIDWNHPSPKLYGKLLAPFLTQPYAESLKSGQISLAYDGGFKIKVGNLEFPVNAATTQHLELGGSVEQTLKRYNSDRDFLDMLVAKQYYRLAHWPVALKHINYRRFFDIIDLIGVRMENPAAFEERHRLIFELVQSGLFSGLRVDHIDGLYEPEAYLQQLRERCPEAYVVVEKILTGDEQLPASWLIEGTTGYEFLNYANKLFIQSSTQPELSIFYQEFTGNMQAFSDLLYEAKKDIIQKYFQGDVRNLTRLFTETLRKLSYSGQFDLRKLTLAVLELLACFPVYRTYLDEQHRDDTPFKAALELAEQQNPDLADGFSAIAHLIANNTNSDALHALMRFQQFTGAVMAKGFEDTALYRYPRLLSLDEVGSNPAQFGVSTQEFHEFNRLRQQNWPLTLNATSTHDTKRGEDMRARLNVLSEIPSEFQVAVERWTQINAAKKRQANGISVPDRNEEYYLYQTLLDAYPWSAEEKQTFSGRMKLHMVKALREAKVHTDWLTPKPQYEDAVIGFVSEILGDADFIEAFLPLQRKIAFYGFFNSLSQTLLKITCPGVPDFYQGTELWDLNLVDPDNRRPIDFQVRQKYLTEVATLKPEKAPDLLSTYRDAKAKLYMIFHALAFRKKRKLLFEDGACIPIAVKGVHAESVVAFCRQKADDYSLVVVPRFLSGLIEPHAAWGKANVDWADTYIALPEGAPTRWMDIFTDRMLLSCCGRLSVRDVLGLFPVALLWGDADA